MIPNGGCRTRARRLGRTLTTCNLLCKWITDTRLRSTIHVSNEGTPLRGFRLFKALALPIIATLLVTGVATPASAAATARNTKYMYLSPFPDDSMATSCVTRDIQLDAGKYRWGYVVQGWDDFHVVREITLAKGLYTWRNCIDPDFNRYIYTSSLDTYGNPPAYLDSYYNYSYDGGYQTWGGFLDPLF
jgi:hypothetical protein